MVSGERLAKDFYTRDVLEVAPEMVGKNMVIRLPDKTMGRFMVTVVEAYRGTDQEGGHEDPGDLRRRAGVA